MLYLMLYGGMSEIELTRADVQDLEQTLLGWFLKVQGKGRRIKDQQVPLDPPVINAVRLYLDARGRIRPEDPLFVSHGHRSDGPTAQHTFRAQPDQSPPPAGRPEKARYFPA